MIADSERREVAARLRAAKRPSLMVLMDVLGVGGEGVFARLADLIEPGEPKVKCVAEVKVDGEQLEQLVHDAAVELTGIDRDALLALADEIEGTDCVMRCCDDASAGVMFVALDHERIARRIRKAIGVSEEVSR